MNVNLKEKFKRIVSRVKRIVPGAVAAGMLAVTVPAVPPAVLASGSGYENTGSILRLQQLVEGVDKRMTEMEARVEDFGPKSAMLETDFEAKVKEYQATRDFNERAKIGAEILVIRSKLNKIDRSQIGVYRETIFGLVPQMTEMLSEMEKLENRGFENKADFLDYRMDMETKMQNWVNVVDKLKEEKVNNRALASIESTVVRFYETFKNNQGGNQSAYDQVRASIREMEDISAQMNNVARRLEVERMNLRMSNLTHLARLTLLRLFNGKSGIGSVREVPDQMMANIDKRSKLGWEIESGTGSVDVTGGMGSFSGVNQIHLEELRTGNTKY